MTRPGYRSALISGGGIVGLVAATALAQRGIGVTLIERKPEISDDGGIGLGLQSNALAALARVGIAAECVSAGVPVDELEIFTPAGELVARQKLPLNGGPAWPGFVGISRADLHGILVAAASRAGVNLVASACLASIQDEGEGITVTLSDHRRISADFLVGADGINSTVRRILFPEHSGQFATGEGVWRARINSGASLPGVALIYGGTLGTVGHTPIARGEGYLYAVDRDDRAPVRNHPNLRGAFQELLRDYSSFVAGLLDYLTPDVTYRPLEAVDLPAPWFSGRSILIGDAAHAGPPTLAQGAAMGIEDAVVLAECLASRPDFTAAAVAFMQRRYGRVRAVLEASMTISRAQMRPDGRADMARAQQAAAAVLAQPF